MTPESFTALGAQGFNHVPVTREVFADLDTPLSTYIKLANTRYSYLLESAAQGGEKWGRFSVVGLPSTEIIRVAEGHITVECDGEIEDHGRHRDPLAFVEEWLGRFRYPPMDDLPIYSGGLVGYFGYDTVRYVEDKVWDTSPEDTLNTPDILLMVSNDVIVFDSVKSRMQVMTHANPAEPGAWEAANARLDELIALLDGEMPAAIRHPGKGPAVHEEDFTSSYGEEQFRNDVERIKEYIVAGDVMQVVLSQRMSITLESEPLNLYRALRTLNPSPYMYFMDLGEFHIVSSSPEILARLDNGTVTVRPLAGTRRRGHTPEEDLDLEQELLADPKEIAEHLMLIDLGRNDIGRVCRTGTVEVTEQFVVERYSHVMHIASNVQGEINEGYSAVDLLRATLPVGTLSGAPKIRAMEIIDELEPERRGIFGGAVGYISWNGNMDTAIAIRTAVVKDGRLFIQAGAGVVADSIPRLEWKETVNKARAMFRAAAFAEQGLRYVETFPENPRDTAGKAGGV
ncbi:MAG: anthranilate synthase component I [Gammaproteobacteria bacterium]|nr:anthranilate synthase component I [Gammaproteobacteria bacterium]